MKCRTIKYVAKEEVDLIDINVPDPVEGQVQVETLACGVCAWDIHTFKHGPGEFSAPAGHEGVGRVVKVGPGVTTLKEGDWVTAGGLGFSEFHTAPAKGFYKLPVTAGKPQDWIVEPVACIVTGLDHCQLKAADRLAVVGCGFMGLMFVQALSHSLVDSLIAIDLDPKRLELARQFGATETINAADADIKALSELNLDTVIDATGHQKGLDLSSQIVRPGGRLNLFGWNHGRATVPTDLWHLRGLTVVNSAPGSAIRDPWPIAIRMLDRKFIDLRPLISDVAKLDTYPTLLGKAIAAGSGYLKGVVAVANSLGGH